MDEMNAEKLNKVEPWKSVLVGHCVKLLGEYVYMPAINYNALYRFRQDGTEVTYLGSFEGEGIWRKHLFGAIAESRGILYLPPMNGCHIASYEIATGKFRSIELDEQYGSPEVASKFFGALVWREYVFFIPCRYRALVRIDTRTGELRYLDSFIQRYWSEVPRDTMLVKNGYFIKEDELYLAGCTTNQMIRVNLCTEEAQLLDLVLEDGEKEGFFGMCADGNDIFLVRTYAPQIVKYSTSDYSVTTYATGIKAEQYPFINIVKLGNGRLAALAYMADKSVILDPLDGSVQNVWEQGKDCIFEDCWDAENYFIEELDSERYIKCGIRTGYFTMIEKKNGNTQDFYVVDEKDFTSQRAHYLQLMKLSKKRNLFMREGELELLDFIRILSAREEAVMEKEDSETVGMKIYEQLRK